MIDGRLTALRQGCLAFALGTALLSAAACRSKAREPEDAGSGGGGERAGSGQRGGADAGSSAGGRSASGGGGATTTVPGAAWLGAGWDHVDTLPGCSSFVAREPARVWPGFTFESCGTGCQRADFLPNGRRALASTLGTAATVVDGRLRLSLSVRTFDQPKVFLLGTYDFGDGAALALVAETGAGCFAQFAGRGSPQVMTVVPAQAPDPSFKIAWFDLQGTGQVQWLESTVTTTLETFDVGTTWGRMISRSTVMIGESPLTTSLRPIYEASGVLYDPSGRAGLLGFSEWVGTEGRILAWRDGPSASVVARGQWHPARFGMSEKRFFWIGATGPQVSDGAFESARLYSCEVSPSLDPCRIEEGPELPILASDGIIAAEGRWVAFNGCSETDCDPFVFDREANTLYKIARPVPDHGAELIGVSGSELFVADYLPANRGNPDFDALLRYDLNEIASFGVSP